MSKKTKHLLKIVGDEYMTDVLAIHPKQLNAVASVIAHNDFFFTNLDVRSRQSIKYRCIMAGY